MFKKALSFFLKGLLITIPLMIIFYLFYISFIEFDLFLQDKIIGDRFHIPGLGIIIFIIVVTGVGFLSTTYLFKPLSVWFLKTLDKIPLLKTIYSAITDLLSAFVGKKKRFSQPVLVKMDSTSNLEKIGFVTDEDLKYLENSEGKVGVYFPFSYGIMGAFYIVPKRNISLIDHKASDLMKYIVSGGISETEEAKQEEE